MKLYGMDLMVDDSLPADCFMLVSRFYDGADPVTQEVMYLNGKIIVTTRRGLHSVSVLKEDVQAQRE